MKIVDYARSLSILPSSTSYDSVRPHHLAIGYVVLGWLASTKAYQKMSVKVLSLVSKLTDGFIPLVHMGLVPDFLIRTGIRLRLR